MYHEVSFHEHELRRRRNLLRGAAALALVCALAALVHVARVVAREQAVSSVRESIVMCAQQCLAVEGAYPSSLSYLEASYGLVVNHADYTVAYEWLGDNVAPSVVVRTR